MKLLIAAGFGLLMLHALPSRAQTPIDADVQVQQADWYCGPHCQYWRHRRWEQRHRAWERHREWEYRHHHAYGYPYYRRY